ncbi:MAG: hypothetical protein HZB26_06105 [Candidatus Hydrogenedentes bacterium]|nr:hypothetical protein [Candidatus Hydrogenedentota bacterium]
MTERNDRWNTTAENGKTAIVQREHSAAVAGALARGENCETMNKGGRGEVLRFPIEGGAGIVRVCRRGGVIRRLIKDSYLFLNRPLREWRIHVYAHEHGLRVPEPLGVCWERRGLTFRGALATREIADAQTLSEYLSGYGKDSGKVMMKVGGLVRQMHALGVVHGDLQVGNILVAPDATYLIDFGNAQTRSELSAMRRAQDVLRFRRSLQKNGFSSGCYARFCEGYGTFLPPFGMDFGYRLKGALSDLLAGRQPRGGE